MTRILGSRRHFHFRLWNSSQSLLPQRNGEGKSMKATDFGTQNILIMGEFHDCKDLHAGLRAHCVLFCNSLGQALESIEGGFVPDIICNDSRLATSKNLVRELTNRLPNHQFVVVTLPFCNNRNSATYADTDQTPATVDEFEGTSEKANRLCEQAVEQCTTSDPGQR